MITILYPYIASAAAGDELRLSLRSLSQNLKGRFEPCVIGDIPDWYTGAAIPLPRITQDQYRQHTGKRFHDKWHYLVDQAWKYAAAAQCDQVSGTFVVFYDDTYVMRPLPVEYFLTARYRGDMPDRPLNNNAYWEALMRTRKRLMERGLPILDFDTHHPFPMHKSDLPLYYREFNPLVSPASCPNQYHNWRRSLATLQQHSDGQFQYVNSMKCKSDNETMPDVDIVNFAMLTPAIEARLRERFNSRSPWEKQ